MQEGEAGIGPNTEETPKTLGAARGKNRIAAEPAAGGSIYRTKAENATGGNAKVQIPRLRSG
jgi:hypothetical protein